jgi:hypothetical protein
MSEREKRGEGHLDIICGLEVLATWIYLKLKKIMDDGKFLLLSQLRLFPSVSRKDFINEHSTRKAGGIRKPPRWGQANIEAAPRRDATLTAKAFRVSPPWAVVYLNEIKIGFFAGGGEDMRSLIVRILLSCGLLLLGSISFYAQESGQTEGNKKIVVIFKGNNKSTVAPVALDGTEKGELPNESYIAIPAKDGSHEVTVGKNVTHGLTCYLETISSGGNCSAGGAQNSITMTFSPVSIKVDLSKNEKAYILVEPYKPEGCCSQMSRMKLVDYKLREIKEKDAEKLVKKYKAIE